MTLGFFPSLHSDELLYSAFARYSDQTSYPNALNALNDLFGNQKVAAIVDFPNRLERFIAELPSGHNYTSEHLINDHTLFPFYEPFLPPDRAKAVRLEMKEEGDNHVRAMLGITAGRIPLPSHLRYCPICVDEDRKKYRETYWHRTHQITGIEVCPTHSVFLEHSTAQWQERSRSSSRFFTAEQAVKAVAPRPLDLTKKQNDILLRLAKASAWLLSNHGLTLDSGLLRARYYNALLKRGYAYYNGRIRTTELLNAFIQFYSTKFLSAIHCPINSGGHSWIIRLLMMDKIDVVQPPLRHLLLLIFLGHTAEQIFTSFSEYKPFGDGPWPCLNRAADHYQQLIITQCRITDCLVKKKHGRPMGMFSCKCGFVYHRIGPDNSTEDRFRSSSVQSYGPMWERALQKLWGNVNIPIKEVSQRLGVSELTVIRHAIRLCLPMNVPGTRQVNGYERYRSYRKTMQDAQRQYRIEWLAVRSANPKSSRKQLIAIAGFLYQWLRKNDSEWIEKHLPPVLKINRQVKHKDWKHEDRKLAAAVKESARRIKTLPGRPVRASITAITREIGHRAWIERRLTDLPLTAKSIHSHAESLESYSIRKVMWAEAEFRQRGVYPTRMQLMTHATIRNKTGKTPTVQSAVDAAMERLR